MCAVSPQKGIVTINSSGSFQFRCHADLPCFTQCCRDVNIYLTPYDVLRMRKKLGLGSNEFLTKYTRHFLSKNTHFPIVQLAMDPQTLYCRLVADDGCSIYDDRPWACRMYPLDLTERHDEYRTIVSEQKCLGLKESALQSVTEWLNGQGIEPYLQMDEVFQAIVPAEHVASGKLEPGVGKILYLAYDLDQFMALLKDERFRTFYELDEETLRRVEEDGEALLRLAFRYIRSQLDELLA